MVASEAKRAVRLQRLAFAWNAVHRTTWTAATHRSRRPGSAEGVRGLALLHADHATPQLHACSLRTTAASAGFYRLRILCEQFCTAAAVERIVSLFACFHYSDSQALWRSSSPCYYQLECWPSSNRGSSTESVETKRRSGA